MLRYCLSVSERLVTRTRLGCSTDSKYRVPIREWREWLLTFVSPYVEVETEDAAPIWTAIKTIMWSHSMIFQVMIQQIYLG